MDINGVLTKRGGRFKTWHRRHFELHNNTLSYYVYDGGPLKGEYIITADTTIEHSKLRKHCFCLSQKTGRTLFMFADSISDQELWMNALNRAIVRIRMHANQKGDADKQEPRPRSSTTGHVELSESDRPTGPYQHMNLWELHITVLQARNLSAKGSNNTYAKVVLDTQSSTTKVVKKELNPVWDENFSFVWSAEQRYARVEVWDTDPLLSSRDNFLGVVYIPILSMPYGGADAKWYTLGKRSSRSRISGEIQILAYSDKARDENSHKLLRELQNLPELANTTSVNSFCTRALAGLDTNDTSKNDEYMETLGQIAGRFPTQMPPIETEEVEDIALKVSMKPFVERSSYGGASISSDGILVLTNYRLLFVSHSRLAFANEDTSTKSSAMAELTTAIPLAQIVSVELSIAQDPLQNTGVLYDSLTLRTNDSRVFSIVFLGMELGVNDSATEFKTHNESSARRGLFTRTRSRRSASMDSPAPNPKDKQKHSKQTRRTSVSKDAAGTENISYLEAQNSQEGPPSQRFCFRLQWKIINRRCLVSSLKTVHQSVLHAVLRGAGVDIPDGENVTAVGRTAISTNDITDLDDGTMAETVEPFTRESDVKDLTAGFDHTADGLRQWIKSLPSQLKFGLYKELQRGWNVYSPHAEFARMGIPDALWRISDVNSEYELCSTYPAVVAVPTSVDDHSLTLASLFRSRGRFPALSWRHPSNYCSLTRSSQPLVGLGQHRSADDEQLIRAINQASSFNGIGETVNLTTNRRVVPGKQVVTTERGGAVTKPLVIVDARPKINAQANQAVGKGYEMGKSYEDCRVIFMGIANIHVMRKSIDALESSCSNSLGDDVNWLKNLDNSGWLQHVSLVLSASTRIVHCITKEAYSVLVHCSDGWDRTAQLTSLSMLMMDPYYRTFEGFQVLIEKEWFSFGHKFCDRLGWRDQGWSDEERSPVFHQFLDCVFQCIQQNPTIFEFNESLLLFIATHMLSGWFGNVFANNEMERLALHGSTLSIWTYIGLNKDRFCNASFAPYADVWIPRCSPQNISLWRDWFLKWHNTLWEIGWNRKNEDFSDVHDTPSEWMADSEVQRCCYCNQRFDFIHRRHHCRACGQIFCESCVKNFRIVRTVSETTPVRVCFSCVQLMDEGVEKVEDDLYGSDQVDGASYRSHKDSTSSIFGKIRSRQSDFTIGSEKYSLDPSSNGGGDGSGSRVVSTRTEKSSMSSSPNRDSARTSFISRVGMMMKSKSTNSVTSTTHDEDIHQSYRHSDGGVNGASAALNRDSEESRMTRYPTEPVAAAKKVQPRTPKSEYRDADEEHAAQSIHPFSSTEQQETDNCEDGRDEEEEEEEEEGNCDEGSVSSKSVNSEKRVNFALDANSYQDPVDYYQSHDKHRSMDRNSSRHGSSRSKKSSSRARSHSPADHRERQERHRGTGTRKTTGTPSSSSSSSSHKPMPKQLKIERTGTNLARDPLRKAHSGRYDAFTKPVNLGPRRPSSST